MATLGSNGIPIWWPLILQFGGLGRAGFVEQLFTDVVQLRRDGIPGGQLISFDVTFPQPIFGAPNRLKVAGAWWSHVLLAR